VRGHGGHGGGVDSCLLGVLMALFFFCGVGSQVECHAQIT
jgi:hypothetical protein